MMKLICHWLTCGPMEIHSFGCEWFDWLMPCFSCISLFSLCLLSSFFSLPSLIKLTPSPPISLSLSPPLSSPWQCGRDAENFDRFFTRHLPELTPPDQELIGNLDQEEFHGFSFVNPEYPHTTHWPCHISLGCTSNPPHLRNTHLKKKKKTVPVMSYPGRVNGIVQHFGKYVYFSWDLEEKTHIDLMSLHKLRSWSQEEISLA